VSHLLEDLLVDTLGEPPLDVLDGALVAVLLQVVERVLRHVGHAQVVVLPHLVLQHTEGGERDE
jgi:hypothetical protein